MTEAADFLKQKAQKIARKIPTALSAIPLNEKEEIAGTLNTLCRTLCLFIQFSSL